MQTARLRIRPLAIHDAAFLCQLFNQPSWLANIGDRGVRDAADAERHIRDKTRAHFREHGFGMNVAELLEDGTPVGVCGLVQRTYLPSPDLGYALLETRFGQGYAREMASLVVDDAFTRLGQSRLYAMVLPGNHASQRVLDALAFRVEDDAFTSPEGERLRLYVREARDG